MRLHLVPGRQPPDLLELPWTIPLEQWDSPRLVRMVRGTSRHVVRFVGDGERVYALKEMEPDLTQHEYTALRRMALERLPVVEAVGLVSGRESAAGEPLDSVLVTRYLDFSLPYRYLFGVEGGAPLGRRLLDAAVVLLVRLHLDGWWWGDCSLNNLLFRRDAGALTAYLVDAETADHREAPLPDRLRETELDLARENLVGGILDLQAGGRALYVDPVFAADKLQERYDALWQELTGAEEAGEEDRHRIDQRIRRLNDLGFDVGEVVVEHDPRRRRLRLQPALVEEGHSARELRRLTGLEVQENQARRLLNDIASFGAHLERTEGRLPPPAVVAGRWMVEVYERFAESVPAELRGRREVPELFHELLEHRYFLSEAAGQQVDTWDAAADYLDGVLRARRDERVLAEDD